MKVSEEVLCAYPFSSAAKIFSIVLLPLLPVPYRMKIACSEISPVSAYPSAF